MTIANRQTAGRPERNTSRMSQSLEERVARLEAIEAARNTTQRYARAVDELDWPALEDVFTHDAVLVSRSSQHDGRDAVMANYRRALDAPIDRKHFIITTDAEQIPGGDVVVRSYFIYTYAGTQDSSLGWGNYVDRIRFEDGTARICRKQISIDHTGTVLPGWMIE